MADSDRLLGPAPGEAITPEVVESQESQLRAVCPGCRSGTPHREANGRLMPGHALNARGRARGSRNNTTKLALAEIRAHVLKAIRVLVGQLDSPNEWIANASARTIVEYSGATVQWRAEHDAGPLLVFPPGTKMAVQVPAPAAEQPAAAAPTRTLLPAGTRAAIAEIRRRVPALDE